MGAFSCSLSCLCFSDLAEGEAEAALGPARGCAGAEGEPGPTGADSAGNPGALPERRAAAGLPALRQDEVCSHHRAAQA